MNEGYVHHQKLYTLCARAYVHAGAKLHEFPSFVSMLKHNITIN